MHTKKHRGQFQQPLREVWRDLTSACHIRMFHIPTLRHVIPSSSRPTPQITCCLPAIHRAASQRRVFICYFFFFVLLFRSFLLLTDVPRTQIHVRVLATSPPQTLRKDAEERGTALRHWDAVSRQSRPELHPTNRKIPDSRKQIVYLLFLALTQIQTAVTELQM